MREEIDSKRLTSNYEAIGKLFFFDRICDGSCLNVVKAQVHVPSLHSDIRQPSFSIWDRFLLLMRKKMLSLCYFNAIDSCYYGSGQNKWLTVVRINRKWSPGGSIVHLCGVLSSGMWIIVAVSNHVVILLTIHALDFWGTAVLLTAFEGQLDHALMNVSLLC